MEENTLPVIQYFKDLHIELPTNVKSALEDVFRENENIESADCYHKEDRHVFEEDITVMNSIELSTAGWNNGTNHSFYTYYGKVQHLLSEEFILYDADGNVIETLYDNKYDGTSHIVDENDYVVILHETLTWNSSENKHERKKQLLVYCPIPGDTTVDDVYADEYEKIKNEMSALEEQ